MVDDVPQWTRRSPAWLTVCLDLRARARARRRRRLPKAPADRVRDEPLRVQCGMARARRRARDHAGDGGVHPQVRAVVPCGDAVDVKAWRVASCSMSRHVACDVKRDAWHGGRARAKASRSTEHKSRRAERVLDIPFGTPCCTFAVANIAPDSTHTHAHAHAHKCTHTHTHAHTCTHTHTRAHPHIRRSDTDARTSARRRLPRPSCAQLTRRTAENADAAYAARGSLLAQRIPSGWASAKPVDCGRHARPSQLAALGTADGVFEVAATGFVMAPLATMPARAPAAASASAAHAQLVSRVGGEPTCSCSLKQGGQSRRRCGPVPAQMWASPGADVGQSRRRCGPVPARCGPVRYAGVSDVGQSRYRCAHAESYHSTATHAVA